MEQNAITLIDVLFSNYSNEKRKKLEAYEQTGLDWIGQS